MCVSDRIDLVSSRVGLGHNPVAEKSDIRIPVCTAQGGSGSFKDRKPIGEVRCCESWMAEQTHWWTDKWLEAAQWSCNCSIL